MTPLQQRTLQVAKRYVGASETQGSNRGPVIARFQMWFGRWMLGQPYCAAFATWCIHTAAKELGVTPLFPKSASSTEIYQWAAAQGELLPQPEAGCVGLVKATRGPKLYEHTFLVHTIEAGEVVTVEGNLGNAIRWNRRSVTGGYAWVRIE